MVNLPEELRLTLVMEGISEVARTQQMIWLGYGYIDLYRRMCLATRQFLIDGKPTVQSLNLQRKGKRVSPFTYGASLSGIAKPTMRQDEAAPLQPLVAQLHRPLSAEHANFLEQHPVSRRDATHWNQEIAEGVILRDAPADDALLTRLLRTLQFINRLTAEIAPDHLASREQSGAFYDRLGRAIFTSLAIDNRKREDRWEIDRDCNLGFPYLIGGDWRINLVTGTVYSSEGKISGLTNFPWEKETAFLRLFPVTNGIKYSSLGGDGCVGFTHPQYEGAFRLIPQGVYSWKHHVIQRRMAGHGDIWFEYYIGQEKLPPPLSKDHALWLPIRESGRQASQRTIELGGTTIKGLITRLGTLEVVYALTAEGAIVEVADRKGTPKANGYELDALEETYESLTGFENFELLDRIVTYGRAVNRVKKIDKLMFPRYTSLDNNPLMFFEHEGEMVWAENREFALPKAMPTSLLGTVSNYLYLQSTKNRTKGRLIVPIQQIDQKAIGPRADGEFSDRVRWPQGKNESELHATQRYTVLEVEGRHVHAKTLEGKLLLAYVQLSQKKYEEAIALFKGIKPTEGISLAGMFILELIQRFELGEDHPDGKMVQLYALALSIGQRDQIALKAIDQYFAPNDPQQFKPAHMSSSDWEWLESLRGDEAFQLRQQGTLIKRFGKIHQSANKISIGCRLPADVEADLFGKLYREGSGKRAKIESLSKCDLGPSLRLIKARERYLRNELLPAAPQLLSKGQPCTAQQMSWSVSGSLVNLDEPDRPDPDGTLFVKGEAMSPFPGEESELLAGLMEINAFLGNMNYINKPVNRVHAESWLEKHSTLKAHYLKVRTFNMATQQQQLKASLPVAKALGQRIDTQSGIAAQISRKRLELEKNREGCYNPSAPWETKLLDPSNPTDLMHIRSLHASFVPFLGIDWACRESDPHTKRALEKLAQVKRTTTDEQLKKEADKLSVQQFKALIAFQGPYLTHNQLHWLPVEKVPFLKAAA
jgi:hypothetical protein